MLSHVYSAALRGIEAHIVKVEVDFLPRGLPGWHMVGLLETAVKEARDRVGAAIRNSGFKFPNRKTIVNLAPAGMKKSGAHYDLAIAMSLLTAARVVPMDKPRRFLFAGELSLTGTVLPVEGVLLMAMAAVEKKLEGVVVPKQCAREAALSGINVVAGVSNLVEAVEFINTGHVPEVADICMPSGDSAQPPDLSEVRGQPFAKRGLEIASAGGHNIALKGPPGTGKTMLAERIPSILPPLSNNEALAVAKIQSIHGLLRNQRELSSVRPFRAPHHSASYAGIIGGSDNGRPRIGEISLAHNGVLFLDEMAEFKRDVLEVLRQPMESGVVRIVRAGVSVTYPARFMLACAFNPCPCGFLSHPKKACTCTVPQIRKYRTKLSGPLLDRIDLHIEVGPPPHEALMEDTSEEPSLAVRGRVMAARQIQSARYSADGKCNAQLTSREISVHCKLGAEEKRFTRNAAVSFELSARSFHRVLKVARTIADLGQAPDIQTCHIAEALQFRPSLEDGS